MGASHKNQHWVPRSYLGAWCDPECPVYYTPYVHVFRRDGQAVGRRAPKNLFFETDLYTIRLPDGERDLRLEHGLCTIEDQFARLRPKIERREILNEAEAGWLLAFVAASHVRTPAMRDHQQQQFATMLRVMDDMQQSLAKMTPEQRMRLGRAHLPHRGGPSLTHEDVRRTAAEPLQQIMMPLLLAELRAFAKVGLRLGILHHDFSTGFVTSDRPCVWFDPGLVNARGVRGVGVESQTVEITLPITPKHAVILSHREQLEGYVALEDVVIVHEMNRRTIQSCESEFVSSSATTHPWWFWEPTDSVLPLLGT